MLDSLDEDEHSPVPGLVHRYPDRVLFLVTDRWRRPIAAIARHAHRLVSNAQDYNFHPQLRTGSPLHRGTLRKCATCSLSGGDPLISCRTENSEHTSAGASCGRSKHVE